MIRTPPIRITCLVLAILLATLCSGCMIAWPYALITDYQEYSRVGGQESRTGTHNIDISPGTDWSRFPIIPGIVHYRRKRLDSTLVVYDRGFERGKSHNTLIIDSLIVQHANGKRETVITSSTNTANRTYALKEPWTPVGKMHLEECNMVVEMSGQYISPNAPAEHFTFRQPWYYGEGIKTEKESWYRGP